MSSVANWSYTARATIWQLQGKNDDGIQTFSEPIIIDCDYGVNAKMARFEIGREQSVKNVIWTEFVDANLGDYVLIGESSSVDPLAVGADEIIHIQRFADTFGRKRDDYALLTGGG